MAKSISELLSKKKRSAIVKKAKYGHDFGKKGKGFDKLTSKLESQGKSASSAKKIAGSQFWKQMGKK